MKELNLICFDPIVVSAVAVTDKYLFQLEYNKEGMSEIDINFKAYENDFTFLMHNNINSPGVVLSKYQKLTEGFLAKWADKKHKELHLNPRKQKKFRIERNNLNTTILNDVEDFITCWGSEELTYIRFDITEEGVKNNYDGHFMFIGEKDAPLAYCSYIPIDGSYTPIGYLLRLINCWLKGRMYILRCTDLKTGQPVNDVDGMKHNSLGLKLGKFAFRETLLYPTMRRLVPNKTKIAIYCNVMHYAPVKISYKLMVNQDDFEEHIDLLN